MVNADKLREFFTGKEEQPQPEPSQKIEENISTKPKQAHFLYRQLQELEQQMERLEAPQKHLREKIGVFVVKEGFPANTQNEVVNLIEKFVLEELL